MVRNWRLWTTMLLLPLAACIPTTGNGNANGNSGEETIDLSANLTGGGEVPPVETNATGTATFEFHPDDDELHFTVNVNNGVGITAAHIHAGGADATGPVVASLFVAEDDVNGVTVNGELATGIITADDLLDTLAGLTVQELVDLVNADGVYVNVHSSANPSGEIRGQITLDN